MAQTPRAGTSASVGQFRSCRCSTLFNTDSNLSVHGTFVIGLNCSLLWKSWITVNPKSDLRFEFECSYFENFVISNHSNDFWYQIIIQFGLLICWKSFFYSETRAINLVDLIRFKWNFFAIFPDFSSKIKWDTGKRLKTILKIYPFHNHISCSSGQFPFYTQPLLYDWRSIQYFNSVVQAQVREWKSLNQVVVVSNPAWYQNFFYFFAKFFSSSVPRSDPVMCFCLQMYYTRQFLWYTGTLQIKGGPR